MTQNNLLPDIWTYNMLINGFCNEGKLDEALRLRSEMENLKLLPDVYVQYVINGCFEKGSSSKAFELVDEMNEKGVKPDAVTHNVIIKWYCKEGKIDEASKTVGKMEESGFSPIVLLLIL
ncbi:hypothetical protein LWI29_034553 [Acer saccharum]|uniref:Pentatricopeptide repeat-containing protein n=1 Tax=Acer saccharum TaxID=4024 RepID=A0AA39SHY9_ACESA|nr:hypothetical protein LWI29_034553 [Acer saccharum]